MHILYKMIQDKLAAVGRHDFVKLAGYRNIAKGLRHLDKFLATGDAPDFFIIRLRDAVGLAPEECDVAIAEHRKVLREKEEREQEAYLRSVFKPHLIVGTDGSSQAPVFMKIFLTHRRTIYLSGDQLDEEQVAEIVRDHFANHKGYMEAFGKITCYIYRPIYDESIIFGIDGSVFERVNRPLWGPTGSLSLKNGRTIPTSIFKKEQENG